MPARLRACLPLLFTQAHVWGFHRKGPARSVSFNEDRMCALLFCRNVRFSKQWKEERRQKKRAWACLHVCCVELVKLVLRQGGIWKGIQQRQKVHSKERPMLEGTNKLHSSWERARARRNCQILFTLLFLPKLGLYTCSYNYSKYPAFSSSTNMKRVPPKQIFGLYLAVLTSRIMDNEKNNWGHRGKGDNEENKATTHSSYCILWINACNQSIHKHEHINTREASCFPRV